MSYDLVKNGIAALLKGLGYKESTEPFDFENAPAQTLDHTYIINCLTGEQDEEKSETLIDRFYDNQSWVIRIAFKRSAQNDIIVRDNVHRKKDTILKKLDNPVSWASFVRILKYRSFVLEESKEYFLLSITLHVQDTYIY
jgi:hypothetical protein